jgi:hypothetical protein
MLKIGLWVTCFLNVEFLYVFWAQVVSVVNVFSQSFLFIFIDK